MHGQRLPNSLPFATGGGARLRQLDSGTDDSDLVSTSESESDDQEMESEAEDQVGNGDAADVETVSTSGTVSSCLIVYRLQIAVVTTYASHLMLHVFVAELSVSKSAFNLNRLVE